MDYDNTIWQYLGQDKPDRLTGTPRGNERLEPLPEPRQPVGDYLTQAEMQEFLDTLAELLHRMVDICTALAKGPVDTNHN
jgi:hypothetical protein